MKGVLAGLLSYLFVTHPASMMGVAAVAIAAVVVVVCILSLWR